MVNDNLTCLDCGSRMIEEDHHGVILDHCVACGGIWFDVDEIYAYLRAHPRVGANHEPLPVDFKQCTKGVGARCSCCGQDSIELGSFRGISYQRCTWCGGLFIGQRQVREIVASQAGQVARWDPGGELNATPYIAAGAAAVAAGGDDQGRTAGGPVVEIIGHVAEGGVELGTRAALEVCGEFAGAALELVLECVFGIIAGALGG